MSQDIHFEGLSLQPGVRVKVKGFIRAAAKLFRINLGKDNLNIGLHFNPRFDFFGDHNVIVCNSLKNGNWGPEQREYKFPFEDMRTVEVNFVFEEKQFRVTLPDGFEFTFPNRLELETIDFLSVHGDFYVRRVDFE
ncbi:galectin-1-like [Vombatus ursinus]|uniref:galectin-1-like n=1 Tax=Vombatus ursinus TaxID=29139 RepID=UPI000FFD05DE|nr:galectin-1-like [Vombatus ursinus]